MGGAVQAIYYPCGCPVGALLAGCAGCRISLYRVYGNPVRVLHGLCLYVPYGTYTRRIVSGFDLLVIIVIIKEVVGDCCLHIPRIYIYLYVKCSHNPSNKICIPVPHDLHNISHDQNSLIRTTNVKTLCNTSIRKCNKPRQHVTIHVLVH